MGLFYSVVHFDITQLIVYRMCYDTFKKINNGFQFYDTDSIHFPGTSLVSRRQHVANNKSRFQILSQHTCHRCYVQYFLAGALEIFFFWGGG